MSEKDDFTPAEAAVRERLRALPGAEADPAFRDRLRAQFFAGEIPEPGDESRDGGPARVIRLVPAVIALAAAAVLAGFFLVLNRPPAWEFAGTAGEGHVRVGDTRFPASEAGDRLPDLLRPGATIRIEGEAMLDIRVAGTFAVQMAPGSQMTVPTAPGRWIGRAAEGRVDEGEVRFVTGPRFAGASLKIGAPRANVHVTGTTFAVIASRDSTCVCVLDGAVTFERHGGDSRVVEAGMRRTIFADRDEPLDEEIYAMERMKLQMLRDQAGAALREDAPTR